jgi:hypothetical protein
MSGGGEGDEGGGDEGGGWGGGEDEGGGDEGGGDGGWGGEGDEGGGEGGGDGGGEGDGDGGGEGDGDGGGEGEGDGGDGEDEIEGLHVNVTNFSLGKIILVMLFGIKMDKNISYDKMKQLLNPIINTKIYYYTLRCIDPNPEMRVNLYV